MIAIIDYKTGNLRSVENALNRLGAEWTLTANESIIRNADRVLLPGVGHAGEAIARLRESNLDEVIKRLRKPVLGICVGMQVMCRHTAEGDADGIGLFDTRVRRFQPQSGDKVPHMGWNSINNLESKLFKGIEPSSYVYYVHSYRADLCPDTIATTRYGVAQEMFSAALKYENFYGTQFHPEKSGDIGELILKNFLQI